MTPQVLFIGIPLLAVGLAALVVCLVGGVEMVSKANERLDKAAEEAKRQRDAQLELELRSAAANGELARERERLRAEERMWLWREQIERKRSMTLLAHRASHDGSCVGVDCAICQWILNISTEFLPYEQIVTPEQAELAKVLQFPQQNGGA